MWLSVRLSFTCGINNHFSYRTCFNKHLFWQCWVMLKATALCGSSKLLFKYLFKCLFVIQPLKSVQENVLLCVFLWHDWFSVKSKEGEWWLRSLWDLWFFVLKVKMVCAVQSMCCVQKYMHDYKLILWTFRYTVSSGSFVVVAFIVVSVNVTWTGKFWKWKYILSDGSMAAYDCSFNGKCLSKCLL